MSRLLVGNLNPTVPELRLKIWLLASPLVVLLISIELSAILRRVFQVVAEFIVKRKRLLLFFFVSSAGLVVSLSSPKSEARVCQLEREVFGGDSLLRGECLSIVCFVVISLSIPP